MRTSITTHIVQRISGSMQLLFFQVFSYWYNLSHRRQDCWDGGFRCNDWPGGRVLPHGSSWFNGSWSMCSTADIFYPYQAESIQIHLRHFSGSGYCFWYIIKVGYTCGSLCRIKLIVILRENGTCTYQSYRHNYLLIPPYRVPCSYLNKTKELLFFTDSFYEIWTRNWPFFPDTGVSFFRLFL